VGNVSAYRRVGGGLPPSRELARLIQKLTSRPQWQRAAEGELGPTEPLFQEEVRGFELNGRHIGLAASKIPLLANLIAGMVSAA
jgi:hypothetical protein